MLAIRLQRTGRKGHAQFRMVVQESRVTPTSGRVIAYLGNYDPHTKQTTLAKDKAEFYVKNGAHPSERVARLLKQEGVKLPDWVELADKKVGKLRNPDKLRKNRAPEPETANETNDTPEPEAAADESKDATEASPKSEPDNEQAAELPANADEVSKESDEPKA